MTIDKTMNIYQKELSIQITLGGFSFWVSSQELETSGALSCYDFDSVLEGRYSLSSVVEWSVPQVLIIPFELFDHSSIDNYLAAAAMLNRATDRSMFAVRGEYVAVWAVSCELYDYISSRLPSAEHTHSLLRTIDSLSAYEQSGDTMIVEIDSAYTMHLALLANGKLEYAHSMKVQSPEDVLFYTKRIAQERGVIAPQIIVQGSGAELASELLPLYFSTTLPTETQCE